MASPSGQFLIVKRTAISRQHDFALTALNGTAGFSGDNGPATGASLNNPRGVAVDATGHLYISDCSNDRTFTISTLGVANHPITAVYGGDTNFTSSTSANINQVVNQDATATLVTSSANPSVLGDSVTFVVTVSASGPGAGTPTGTVQYVDGGTNLGLPVNLDSSGHAGFTTSALSIGSHSITAVYSGDTNFTTSISAGVSQVVDPVTRVWGSGEGDGNLGTGANWSGGIVEPSDSFVFPAGVAQTTIVNDFPADTTFGSLTFCGSRHIISGNRIVLNGDINSFIPTAETIKLNQLSLDIGFASGMTSVVTDGGDLTIQGAVSNGSELTVSGTGTLKVSSITGSGSTTVAAGSTLQVNYIHQHILSLGVGSVVVLGSPTGSGASPRNTTTENGNAAPSSTASTGEAATEAANVVTTVPTSAAVAADQKSSSAVVSDGATVVPEAVVAASLADAASTELNTTEDLPVVPISTNLVTGEPVTVNDDSEPSIVSNQVGSAALTTDQVIGSFIPAPVSDSETPPSTVAATSVVVVPEVASTRADQMAIVGFGWEWAVPVIGHWASPVSPLMAAGGQVVSSPTTPLLAQSQLQPIVSAAIARWAAAGLTMPALDAMKHVQFVVTDLPGAYLGLAQGPQISLDLNAAEHGWFIDPTPAKDEEFVATAAAGQEQGIDPRAVDRIDLLTVVEHELGHTVGLDDLDPSGYDLMSGQLSTGIRRTPSTADIDTVFAYPTAHDWL